MHDRLQGFIAAWQAKLDEYYLLNYPTFCTEGRYCTVEAIEGKRFWKIAVSDKHGGRSSRAFIDKETGAIYKAASWAAPAKHVRGYITTEDFGMSCMTVYGPNYLR